MTAARCTGALALLLAAAAPLAAQDSPYNVFNPVWRWTSDKDFLSGALAVGAEANGDPLYLCRARSRHEKPAPDGIDLMAFRLGKFLPADGACHVSLRGAEVLETEEVAVL